MAKRSSEFKVFQGPKKRLNLAILSVLFIYGPLTEQELSKKIENLGYENDGSVYRSLRRMVGLYLDILPPKKGAKRNRYGLTDAAHYVLYSEFYPKQTLIDRANKKDISFLLSRNLKILKNTSNPEEVESILKKRMLDTLQKNDNSYWD